jgi:hypothetical protein
LRVVRNRHETIMKLLPDTGKPEVVYRESCFIARVISLAIAPLLSSSAIKTHKKVTKPIDLIKVLGSHRRPCVRRGAIIHAVSRPG